MVSLNTVNQEVDQKYGPFVVEDVDGGDVVLRNIIRLTPNERDQAAKLHVAMTSAQESADVNAAIAAAQDLVTLVSVGDGGKRLVDALDGDAAKLIYVLDLYAEATQLGEAARSES